MCVYIYIYIYTRIFGRAPRALDSFCRSPKFRVCRPDVSYHVVMVSLVFPPQT